VNDGDDELAGIERLLAGRYGVLNLIPWNQVDGMPFQRPGWERAAAMARHLHRRGILTKLRHSAGQDVEGGCGQLRARAAAATPTADGVVVAAPASRRVRPTAETPAAGG
jgi:23S rRNA (adenine2503-C2)-methyltransferase